MRARAYRSPAAHGMAGTSAFCCCCCCCRCWTSAHASCVAHAACGMRRWVLGALARVVVRVFHACACAATYITTHAHRPSSTPPTSACCWITRRRSHARTPPRTCGEEPHPAWGGSTGGGGGGRARQAGRLPPAHWRLWDAAHCTRMHACMPCMRSAPSPCTAPRPPPRPRPCACPALPRCCVPRPRLPGTAAARTSCGAASAPGSWTTRTWSSCGACRTPLESRCAPAWSAVPCKGCGAGGRGPRQGGGSYTGAGWRGRGGVWVADHRLEGPGVGGWTGHWDAAALHGRLPSAPCGLLAE